MSNKKTNSIEINGKLYDADTGRLIHDVSATETSHVIKPSSAATHKVPVTHHSESEPKAPAHTAKPARQSGKAAHRHSPEHAKTLARHSVKKPSASLKRHIKAQSSTDHLATKPAAHIQPKRSVHHVDDRKLSHAQRVSKSHLVKKFNRSQPTSVAVPVTIKRVTRPAQHHREVSQSAATHRAKAPTEDLLERAIRQATSHEQRPPRHVTRKRRGPARRVTSLVAVGCALIILGGFVAYSNVSNVKLKVASAKAGFSASLPGQAPAGYSLSHLSYSPGVVALNYHSNSDTRSFAITEKASAWDSGTLRDSYVASSGQDYQTVEAGGQTLYLLGQNVATWVNGGVWYQVHTNGALSNRQLVTLATSL